MNHSESLKELSKALVQAQSEIENAHKNADNPHFRSTYADLAEIINTTRPVLTKYGLAVVQLPGMDGGLATVETILTHSSGEWLSGVAAAPLQKADPQGVGSALTYLRRYSLAALCNIAQEDDDGEAAVGRPAQQQAVRSNPGTATAPASTPVANNGGDRPCPKCKGKMWDNRATKTKPTQPDFKCRDKACDGVIWPPKDAPAPVTKEELATVAAAHDEVPEHVRAAWDLEDDSLPF